MPSDDEVGDPAHATAPYAGAQLDPTDFTGRMDRMEALLEGFIRAQTSARAAPARASTPNALFGDAAAVANAKTVLRPNPPPVFEGDRTKGRSFLHSVRVYARLLPEAFIEDGNPSEEKLIRFAMSYMSTGSAQRWAERQSSKPMFPFPTWDRFVAEFRQRFVQENEQDHALTKLESTAYHMGKRDVYAYTDDFEDLYDVAGFSDPLVKVTKYRSGLLPAILNAVTTSGNAPALTDYPRWRQRAYQQWEAMRRPTFGPNSGWTTNTAPAVAPVRARPAAAFPAFVAPPPKAPAPIPMELDRTRVRTSVQRACFCCGDPGHFARDCKTVLDVRSVDVLDHVIQQLGNDMLDELVARLNSARQAEEHAAVVSSEEGFCERDE